MKFLVLGLLTTMGWAGTDPKPKASDYPAHGRAARAEIGAEYLSRTISEGGESFYTGIYLVVEVAVYPDKGVTLPVSSGDFQLRINGKKVPLVAQTPGLVAAAMRNPEWERGNRGPTANVGLGGGDIIIGRPPAIERFPGDPQASRGPRPPQAPEQRDKAAQDQGEAALRLALPQVEAETGVSGLVYFAYKSKLNDIRRLELLYEGPAGRQVLVLR
ncbi:hypothetical protein [Paludibaculum fermentans]|uniref:hypothetical protein n=1 Tax=Paludibaculum fermentans TaxID=1473598 RepID=UPI003EBAA090